MSDVDKPKHMLICQSMSRSSASTGDTVVGNLCLMFFMALVREVDDGCWGLYYYVIL